MWSMDAISEFLRLSDLNENFPAGKKELSDHFLDDSPNSKLLSTGILSSQYSPNNNNSPFSPSNLSSPQPLTADQVDSYLASQHYPPSFPTLQPRLTSSGGNLTLWNSATENHNKPTLTDSHLFLPAGTTVFIPDTMPQMPSPHNHHDDDYEDRSSSRKSKNAKGRQRNSGPLSAHAVYARMNRERKKKYIGELEQYRASMKKKREDTRRELDSMRKESQLLTTEITTLRNSLLKNEKLMSLLTLGNKK